MSPLLRPLFRPRFLAAAAALLLVSAGHAGVREGVDAWQAGDFAKAVAEWRAPAEAGDRDAQFNMGQAYKLGRGVPVDPRQARTWFYRAAEQGHRQAQANLGLILFRDGNRAEAMPWISKAAEQGEPRSQYVLATALFNGDHVARDWPRSYALMTMAARAGIAEAKTSLAHMERYVTPADRAAGLAQVAAMDERTGHSTQPAAPAAPAVADRTRPAAAPTAARSGWRLQLGAFRSEAAARERWASLSSHRSLSGLHPEYMPAGQFVRLRTSAFNTRAAAVQACETLKRAGQDCLVLAH